jgi:hypothetical protein
MYVFLPLSVSRPHLQPSSSTHVGARRLLRWTQRLFLHAAAGAEIHPSEAKVTLTVNMWELGQEVGLEGGALRHLMAVAGPR